MTFTEFSLCARRCGTGRRGVIPFAPHQSRGLAPPPSDGAKAREDPGPAQETAARGRAEVLFQGHVSSSFCLILTRGHFPIAF